MVRRSKERNDGRDKTTIEELSRSMKITKHVRQDEEKKQGTRMLKNERNYEERDEYSEKGCMEKCRRGAARKTTLAKKHRTQAMAKKRTADKRNKRVKNCSDDE